MKDDSPDLCCRYRIKIAGNKKPISWRETTGDKSDREFATYWTISPLNLIGSLIELVDGNGIELYSEMNLMCNSNYNNSFILKMRDFQVAPDCFC